MTSRWSMQARAGMLILLRGDEPRIEAEARTCQQRSRSAPTGRVTRAIAESILHTVIHTLQSVILDDASDRTRSGGRVRAAAATSSLLCFAGEASRLVGLLYLEKTCNRTFTPRRIAVLELLASQAAIRSRTPTVRRTDVRNRDRRKAEEALRRASLTRRSTAD